MGAGAALGELAFGIAGEATGCGETEADADAGGNTGSGRYTGSANVGRGGCVTIGGGVKKLSLAPRPDAG